MLTEGYNTEECLRETIISAVKSTIKFYRQLSIAGEIILIVDTNDPIPLRIDEVLCATSTENIDDVDDASEPENLGGCPQASANPQNLLIQMKQEITDPEFQEANYEKSEDGAEEARMKAEEARMEAEEARMKAEEARMKAEEARMKAERVVEENIPDVQPRRSSRKRSIPKGYNIQLGPRKRSRTSGNSAEVPAMPKMELTIGTDLDGTYPKLQPQDNNKINDDRDDEKLTGTDLKVTIRACTSPTGKLCNDYLTKPKPSKMSDDITIVEGLYKCAHCDFSHQKLYRIKKHLSIHRQPRLVCYYCDQAFTDRLARKRHATEVHTGEKPQCKQCPKHFATIASLKIHENNIHSKIKRKLHQCNHCPYTTRHCGNLLRHIRCNHGVDSLVCLFCNENFSDKIVLKAHVQAEHSEEKLMCSLCSKEVRSPSGLHNHIVSEHGDGVDAKNSYKCAGCSFATISMKTLEKHMASIGDHGLECHLCDMQCVCKAQLKMHMAELHPSKANQKRCNFCPKVFTSKNGLYAHKKIFHSGEVDPEKRNVFTCHVCGKGFPIYDYLKRHIRSHDATYEPYQCPKCNKKFKYHRNCKTHKEGCMNLDGFPCSLCGKVLKNEYCLREHVRNMHSNEKKDAYPCRKCGMLFSYSGSRSKHEKSCRMMLATDGFNNTELHGTSEQEAYQEQYPDILYQLQTDVCQQVKQESDTDPQDDRGDNAVLGEHVGESHPPMAVAYEEISSRISELPHISGMTQVALPEDLSLQMADITTISMASLSRTLSSVSATQSVVVMSEALEHFHQLQGMEHIS